MSTVRLIAPAAVQWIVRTLENAGYPAWTVGGAIRDGLRGRPSVDWDFATRATPRQVRKVFRRTVPIGIDHGTVGVLARDGTMFEVTTFRKDVETDGRHAVVEFADSIDDDLARRDFTINAIAWHPLRDEIRDPFSGATDLQNKLLRTVGTATDRFQEDYLRILRALRFAGRFSLTVESETWGAMSALVEHLVSLSPERVREELLKVLAADPAPDRALELYRECGALRVLYPELDALDASVWSATIRTVARLPLQRPYLRLAALLRPLAADDVASVLLRLKLSNALVDETARLAAGRPLPPFDASDADFRRWLRTYGVDRLTPLTRVELAGARASLDAGEPEEPRAATEPGAVVVPGAGVTPGAVVASWQRARAVRRSGAALAVSDLHIDGRGLIGLGLRPGPRFGQILEDLLDWVLEEPVRNERSALEAKALEYAERTGDS